MENEWLFIWLVAPIFSPAAMAIEAYSLLWYVQDMRTRSDGRAVSSPSKRGRADRPRW